MRNFLKVSFSKDKYDLKGNSKNYLLSYDWYFRDRKKIEIFHRAYDLLIS